jgi:hypothetical protein
VGLEAVAIAIALATIAMSAAERRRCFLIISEVSARRPRSLSKGERRRPRRLGP